MLFKRYAVDPGGFTLVIGPFWLSHFVALKYVDKNKGKRWCFTFGTKLWRW